MRGHTDRQKRLSHVTTDKRETCWISLGTLGICTPGENEHVRTRPLLKKASRNGEILRALIQACQEILRTFSSY